MSQTKSAERAQRVLGIISAELVLLHEDVISEEFSVKIQAKILTILGDDKEAERLVQEELQRVLLNEPSLRLQVANKSA